MNHLLLYTIILAVPSHLGLAFAGKWRPSLKWMVGTVYTAIMANVLFQYEGVAEVGYLDPLFLVAVFFGGLYSVFIAGVIGAPFYFFHRLRNKRRSSRSEPGRSQP